MSSGRGTSSSPAQMVKADPATRARVSGSYGKLPISFEANEGQTDARVNFVARAQGYNLFLTRTEAVMSLSQPAAKDGRGAGTRRARKEVGRSDRAGRAVLRMRIEGANPKASVEGEDALPGKVNYFVGGDPAGWRANVQTYG
ncbi:MAG TPA: hypothetical protein VF507_00600, partial [Pyrinomonadaceae bacterium]